jgi:3-hydroxyethyl bacteriochlorophyllide a dehydrogenase
VKSTAIIFVRPKTVELGDVDLPNPTPNDIVVETHASGVSVGTERWAYLGKRPEIRFPNIPGYMAVGKVTEAGAAARQGGYKPGDWVYYFASKLAGGVAGASWMSSHLSRAVVDVCTNVAWDPEGKNNHRCEKMPPGLDPVDAALAGLGAVAMRGIEMAVIPADAQVLIVGMGIVGQFAAQICRLKGAEVTVADRVESRLLQARAHGAERLIDSSREDLTARVRDIAPRGFDIIIDTSSVPAVVNSLFPLLRMHGKFVFQGWYPPPSPLDLNALHLRLPVCFFPCGHTGRAVRSVLRWIKDGQIKMDGLVTHRVKPAQAPEIYRMIAAGSENFLGIVFDWRS